MNIANNYSKKQLAIFDAVLSLLNNGDSFYSLKVADIATYAGIGKGTVYEYFKCKEDIVIGAILYNLDRLIADFEAQLSTVFGFDKMLDELFNIIDKGITENAKTFHLLFSTMSPDAKGDYEVEYIGEFNKRKEAVIALVGKILKQGIIENQIKLHSTEQINFVVNSAIMGYVNGYYPMCHYCESTEALFPQTKPDKLKKYAKMLIVNCLK